MGKLIWNESHNLAEGMSSPVSLITGANLRKNSPTASQKPKPTTPQSQDALPDLNNLPFDPAEALLEEVKEYDRTHGEEAEEE